jgi:small subunit ribosomal protein S7
MPRRAKVVRRLTPPDPKFHNRTLGKFISKLMECGKKGTAERLAYRALTIMETQGKRNPTEIFEQALRNATPLLEVKPRRVGGATYQVPVEIRPERRISLAMRWLIEAAREPKEKSRDGKPMAERLALELLDAAAGQGQAVKKREGVHSMAEANKAFAHYRW